MIVGSIKENTTLEKRVSITPETAKNFINLGLKVIIENNYAVHIGITDKEYETMGVEIKNSSKEVLNNCNLLAKVNCPSDEEILNLKDKTIIGFFIYIEYLDKIIRKALAGEENGEEVDGGSEEV